MQIITTQPGTVTVSGKTTVEKRLSALGQGDASTVAALCNAKGAVGKAARAGVAAGGLVGLANRAANCNYGPIAAYISATIGCSFVISNRASFESIPDRFEALILDVKASKSGGYREAKDGTIVPNAKLAMLMTLKSEFMDMVQQAAEIRAEKFGRVEAAQQIEA